MLLMRPAVTLIIQDKLTSHHELVNSFNDEMMFVMLLIYFRA